MSERLLRYLILSVLVLSGSVLWAQKPLSSPYSRYGVGNLFRTTNSQSMSFGGAGIGLRSPLFVNFQNPASYTAFDTLSFVFEGAISSNTQTLKSQGTSQRANFTTLKHLMFGFPVTHFWKVSAGLLPYSQVGYNVGDEEEIEDVGLVKRTFQGEGGYNQFFMGHAFQLHRNLSLGVNVSYLFGTINRKRGMTFPDSVYYRYFRVVDDISISDFLLTYGLQYHTILGKDLKFNVGAVFTNSTSMKAKKSMLSETYNAGSSGAVNIKDTIEIQPGVKGNIVLPTSYGAGFSLEKEQRWLWAMDFRMENWEKFSMFGEKDSLKNSMELSTGFQFIPNNTSLSGYFQKISYRAGFRYAKSYLQLRSHQLEEMGFTFGLGLPIARTKSCVHVGMEIGRRGTTSDNLIQENYFMITLGVSVFENWFYRRKFE
ncbi:MAG: hypothetical protein AB9842_05160 [Bacteroidales bacterium]